MNNTCIDQSAQNTPADLTFDICTGLKQVCSLQVSHHYTFCLVKFSESSVNRILYAIFVVVSATMVTKQSSVIIKRHDVSRDLF